MKANKLILKAEFHALSTETFKGLLLELIEELDKYNTSGELSKDDGDLTKWTTSSTEVSF